ncbi:porin [Pedobacter sp. SAFR-022]|uniref:porin n=1 Tax=Pedobacter sp. SAFR-022 TaxID=3436861 RepID=UPI003F8218AC
MRLKQILALAATFIALTTAVRAQEDNTPKWYDTFSLRGYIQARYNAFQSNPNLGCEQCDKSWNGNSSFFIRRARLVFSGQIGKQVFFYFQPDFASSTSGGLNFGQIKDAYFDLGLDSKNEYRIRIGQTKIPYGFENMQSSSVRIPLDRADALNSAFTNERDLGVFFYWAPKEKRELLKNLVKDGLKGSGDFGIFAIGVFNGQTPNQLDQNNELHTVARVTWPFAIGNQIIEPGIQGYTGKFVVPENEISDDVKYTADRNYLDQRVAATFVLYPKPFGIQAEFNVGKGPEFNKQTDSIEVQNLKGGYVTMSYLIKKNDQTFIPFLRAQYYDGGKKHELDARSYKVNDFEFGVEWQPVPQFELVGSYNFSKRRYEDFELPDNYQTGNLLRIQAQLNF